MLVTIRSQNTFLIASDQTAASDRRVHAAESVCHVEWDVESVVPATYPGVRRSRTHPVLDGLPLPIQAGGTSPAVSTGSPPFRGTKRAARARQLGALNPVNPAC